MAADELFGKGNEAFVEENFEKAVEFYSKAIEAKNTNDAYYSNRAQAFLKLQKYKEAVSDCSQAINLNAENSKTYLRKGQAHFHLDECAEALESLQIGQKLDSTNTVFEQWITKCQAKMSDQQQACPIKESAANTTNPAQAATSQVPVPPKIRHDWYQTETHVVINIMIKNAKKEDATLDIHENQVGAKVKLPTGNDYTLDLNLEHPVIPNQSLAKILSSKIEIKLKKAEGIHWNKLELDSSQAAAVKQFNPSKKEGDCRKYPSSSPYMRDWDKVVSEIDKEEKEEKPEGDAALNQLFQQIYADGTDEVKKAMNKSFAESGGTVLSTNWKDIAQKKTDIKPPDGMEFKEWQQ